MSNYVAALQGFAYGSASHAAAASNEDAERGGGCSGEDPMERRA